MVTLYNPPIWRNDHLMLYHGTAEASAMMVLTGIDLRRCRPFRDFGRGFYTTTVRRQAEFWAQRTAARSPTPTRPVIVGFEVELDRLSALETLVFIRGDFEAEPFWSLVCRCRPRDVDHGRTVNGGWYDLVAGPVAAFWEQRAAFAGYDQFSFHTPTAVSLLDASTPHLVT